MTAAFLTTLVRVPLAALKTGIGSPPACVATLTSHPTLSHPAAEAIGNVHRNHYSLSFVPWVSAHAPFPARALFLAIMSALTLPTNLNRAVGVPRPAKDRIVPLSRVRGTSDVSGALAQFILVQLASSVLVMATHASPSKYWHIGFQRHFTSQGHPFGLYAFLTIVFSSFVIFLYMHPVGSGLWEKLATDLDRRFTCRSTSSIKYFTYV